MAAAGVGKLIFSIESGRDWALRLQCVMDQRKLPSSAIICYVDIGPTGDWGRPLNSEAWSRFYRYPLLIWDEIYFRQPDVVLIDGRFRVACLMAILLYMQKPVTVLFDDYTERPAYQSSEAFVKPAKIVGRMAVFDVQPKPFDSSETVAIMNHFFRETYHGSAGANYKAFPSGPKPIRADAHIKDTGHD